MMQTFIKPLKEQLLDIDHEIDKNYKLLQQKETSWKSLDEWQKKKNREVYWQEIDGLLDLRLKYMGESEYPSGIAYG